MEQREVLTVHALSVLSCRAAKLRADRGFMERPIQHLYPLELSCDRNPTPCNDTPLNRTAVEFRSRRDADVAARQQIQDIVEEDT